MENYMNDESSNPNIEWKKPGFDAKERLTLKTNVRKAIEYEAQNKNSGLNKNYIPSPAELPKGINKIRKKIKDVYDEEDDDDDDYQIHTLQPLDVSENDDTLLKALQEDEKKFLRQNEEIQTVNTLLQTEQNQKIANAEKLAKDTGMKKGLDKKVLAKTYQNTSIGQDLTNEAINRQVAKNFKFKSEKISPKEAKKLMTGIKRIQQVGGAEALNGLKLQEVLEAGDGKYEHRETIKKMLEKSGRIDNKGKPTKRKANELQLQNARLAQKLEETSRS